MESKTCSKCGQTFSATAEFFNRRAKNRDGLSSWCKACAAAIAWAYHEVEKEDSVARTHSRHILIARKERVATAYRAYREAHKRKVSRL